MALTTVSGAAVHPIGIGTWDISSRWDPSIENPLYKNVEAVKGNEDVEIKGLRYSLERGQNHLDCAELYGAFYTDEVVGQAIAAHGANRQVSTSQTNSGSTVPPRVPFDRQSKRCFKSSAPTTSTCFTSMPLGPASNGRQQCLRSMN